LLDSANLYVAGTVPASGSTPAAGKLVVLNTGSLAVPATSVDISDGFHDRMELAGNSRLFIGARTCTDLPSVPHSGCLTIFNTAAQTAVVDDARGDVTGIAPISGRSVVYVIAGGELVIYDTTTDAPQATQIDIVGAAVDVKLIDP